MRLIDRLPDRVTVDGRTYRCDFDFRNVLRLIDETGREDILPEARVYRALKCVMPRPPRDDILCARVYVEVRKALFPGADRKTEAKKLTDFDQDADLIRAAFLQEYRIDLWKDKLHWLKFTALLSSLPEGSRYADVLGIRARPMPKATKYNLAEREWLQKAKAQYALKVSDEEAAQALQRGILEIFHGLMTKAGGKDG